MFNTELLFRPEVVTTAGSYSYDISFVKRKAGITIMYTPADGVLRAFPKQEAYEIKRDPECTLRVDTSQSGVWKVRNGIDTRFNTDIALIHHSPVSPVATLIMNGEEVMEVENGVLRFPSENTDLPFPPYEDLSQYFGSSALRRNGQLFVDRLVRGNICFAYAAHLKKQEASI